MTTLEEVFLRVGHGIDDEEEVTVKANSPAKQKEEELLGQQAEDTTDSFSIANVPAEEQTTTGTEQIGAILRRRLQAYHKSGTQFLFEILIPVVLVAIGLAFSKVEFFYDSPARNLTPSAFPAGQRILYNQNLLSRSGSDIQPADLLQGLPYADEYFELTPFDKLKQGRPSLSGNLTRALLAFDDELQRTKSDEAPYSYASYYILEASNASKQFKVATFVNTTSQDAAAYFSQFMYEAIIRQATGNPNFRFNVTTAP